jgi:hypothetical protein
VKIIFAKSKEEGRLWPMGYFANDADDMLKLTS